MGSDCHDGCCCNEGELCAAIGGMLLEWHCMQGCLSCHYCSRTQYESRQVESARLSVPARQ